jgi:protein-tyrosine phosphatase
MPAGFSEASSEAVGDRLAWEGCFNARDLGGHRTASGRLTRFGEIVRSDTPDRLTASGWAALSAFGVRTIVDLRDASERSPLRSTPADVQVVEVPLLDPHDQDFWADGRWRGLGQTHPFYLAVLGRWPDRIAAAVRTVAQAPPGGVVIHCQAGRDRTGLVVASILSLVEAGDDSIIDDYARSEGCLRPLYQRWADEAEDQAERARILRSNHACPETMAAVLAGIDLTDHLRANGVTQQDVECLQARLVPS